MDGSGCWDRRSWLPHIAGLQQGVSVLKPCVEACLAGNIVVPTMFVFSAENWNRRAEEVSGLMDLLASSLVHEFDSLKSSGAQLHFIGDRWYCQLALRRRWHRRNTPHRTTNASC